MYMSAFPVLLGVETDDVEELEDERDIDGKKRG